jgi:hypothetical protein
MALSSAKYASSIHHAEIKEEKKSILELLKIFLCFLGDQSTLTIIPLKCSHSGGALKARRLSQGNRVTVGIVHV